jgi:hypothetical protein
MKLKPTSIIQPLLVYGSIVLLLACNTPPSSESDAEGPVDVEAAYFNLSKEAQTEILGTQVKSMREMKKELLAKADADGDGQLSEAEKASLRASLKSLKDEMKAELENEVDKDADGEVSDDEKKAGLDAMGQKIKEAIQATHEKLRTARQEARERIKAACSNVHGQGSDEELAADLEACRTVAADEKDKLHAMLKDSLEALKAEIEELKGLLATVESQNATI